MILFLSIYFKEKKPLNVQKDAHDIYNSKKENGNTRHVQFKGVVTLFQNAYIQER